MSVTEPTINWDYSNISDGAPIDASEEFQSEPPLQFAALYAQSQPSEGKVALSQLGGILSRAQISGEQSALILELCTEIDESNARYVTESNFYWALHQAATIQTNEAYVVQTPDSDPINFDKELRLEETADSTEQGEEEPQLDYDPTTPPQISVAVQSKDAGSYLFKHVLYTIEGTFKEKSFKNLRRYRDFDSLVMYLTSKYPFRVIPVLPPKRFAMNGRYQDEFLNRRAAGLSRFLNLLAKHPVLSQDEVFRSFLFELAPLYNKPDADELKGKQVSPLFISQWKAEKAADWRSIEAGSSEFLADVTAICLACERYFKRNESAGNDAALISRSLSSMSSSLHGVYPNVQDDIPVIQQRLDDASQFAGQARQNREAASRRLHDGPLEELKLYRDLLMSVLELFRRIKQLGGNTVQELKRKIESFQRKLAAASTRPDIKEEELHNFRQGIQNAQISIREQTNRDWQIKMIVSQELVMIQSTQYQISVILRSFASAITEESAERSELVSKFTDSADLSPLKS